MRTVGIRTLKSKLSEYLRLVDGGETVLVTDRDRVVAELSPPRPERSSIVADAVLADAVRRGWLTPPTLGAPGAPPSKPIGPLRGILEDLAKDREDR